MNRRRVKESPIERGASEEYAYQFALTDKVPPGTYANAFNALYEKDASGDYVIIVSGWGGASPTVTSDIFTTGLFVADVLVPEKRYRLHWGFDIDGSQWDWNLYIDVRI